MVARENPRIDQMIRGGRRTVTRWTSTYLVVAALLFAPAVFAGPAAEPGGKVPNIALSAGGSPMVIGMTLSDTAAGSRIALELSDAVDIRAFTLTAPNRIVLEMPAMI